MNFPLKGYEKDPTLHELIIRSRGALALLSVEQDRNADIRLETARAFREALEGATGESFAAFDFSDIPGEPSKVPQVIALAEVVLDYLQALKPADEMGKVLIDQLQFVVRRANMAEARR